MATIRKRPPLVGGMNPVFETCAHCKEAPASPGLKLGGKPACTACYKYER